MLAVCLRWTSTQSLQPSSIGNGFSLFSGGASCVNLCVFQKLLLAEMDRVVKAEEALLVTMNFDFFVSHPYKPICSVVKEFGFTNRQSERDRTFFQIAWNFANDSLRTTLCLQPFRPMDIAAACVNLSASALSVQLPKAAEGGHWWTKYGVSPETLQGQ
ncbi:unnamed protein product [Closterium sp. Naga37s-1]|nr:unnamed protein product [Closterium sp. Naga37s-1]